MNLKHFFQIISPLLLLCFLTINVQAQPTECFDFENLDIDQIFGRPNGQGPGDTIPLLFSSDVITTLEPFIYENGGEPGFWNVSVVDWPLGNWSGTAPYLFVSNTNMIFDFTHLPDVVSQVSFDFWDGGGEHNISVNGDTIYNVYEFKNLPINIAPDVTLTIDNNRLYLDGNIRQLLIGGQELGFDNFCYVVNDVAPMCIDNVVARPEPCTPNGVFYTEISFDHYNPASDSFFIRGNWQNYGQFAYGQSSYRIGPIEANPNLQYEFVIVDAADPNCSNFTEIGSVSCNENNCNIQILWADTGRCQTDGTQGLYFGFYQENIDTNGFIVQIDSQFQAYFPYDPIADSIGYFLADLNLSSGEHKLTICNESDITCCKTIQFFAPNCNENNTDCRIFDIKTTTTDCKPDGTVDVRLNFEHESLNGDFFTVLINGSNYDTFRLAQLPLDLENLTLYPDSNLLSICVYQSTTVDTDDHFECCTDIFLEAPICDTTDCEISNLTARTSNCQDDGLFDLYVDFKHQNASIAHFNTFIDDWFYDSIPFLVDSGYIFSNLALATGSHILTICGDDQRNCCQRIEFLVPECTNTNDCRVFNIKAEASDCKPNGLHDVFIDFEHHALTGNFFQLLIDSLFIDTFRLTQLPLTIKDIDLQTGISLLEICVFQSTTPLTTDVTNCCVEQEIRVPDCSTNACLFSALRKKDIYCNDDGSYDLVFGLTYIDSIDLDLDSLNVIIDGETYGFNKLGFDLFQIKNIKVGVGEHRLTVSYNNSLLDCSIATNFDAPECNTENDCSISNIQAFPFPCDSTGYFWVSITFGIENPSNQDSIEIILNGQTYGIFERINPVYAIGPFKGDGITPYEFIIQDIENPSCRGFVSIPPVGCLLANDCSIDSLYHQVSDCGEDGTVDIIVLFDTELKEDSGFNVFIDEQYIETYGYHQIPFVLNKIDLPAGKHQLSICRNDVDDCCMTQEIFIPECGTCEITNVTAIATDCENEDYFFVDLKFDVTHPTTDKFRVVGNSQLYGVFEYGQDSYQLGPLDGDGTTMYEFIVQDLQNESCASFAELERVIDCEQGFVWPGDANFDNVTDNFDLLNIGLAFGKIGPNRIPTNPDSSDIAAGYETAWEAKEAEDWDYRFQNGLNAKHADCNGDGIIDELDIRAIEENYFFTHGEEKSKAFSEGTSNDPALYVDFPALADIEMGKEIKVPIVFGSENIPATAYGLAFTVAFDPSLIIDSRIEFIESWLGTPNEDLLTINKSISSNGFIEVALTRKEGSTPFGAGTIGNFILIIDNIEGFTGDKTIEIQKVQAIDNEGDLLAVHTPKTVLSSLTDTQNTGEEEIDITVYPNPASDIIAINYPLQSTIDRIDIRSISGRLIRSITPTDMESIDISGLTNGVYILELQTGTTTVYRKLVKQ